MKLSTGILAAAGLALAVGLSAVAGEHARHDDHSSAHAAMAGPFMVPQMLAWLADSAMDDLNATEPQKSRIVAVKDRILNGAKALHGAHDTTHAEFKQQWDAKTMDAGKLHSLVDARVEELRRVLHDSVDGVVEIHDTLTPAQRETITKRIESMHASN